MSARLYLHVVLLSLSLVSLPALSQTAPAAEPQTAGASIRPAVSQNLHGINAGVTASSLHDSLTGWATLVTPAIGYSFSDRFNVDATLPIYMYRLADSIARRPTPDALLVARRGEIGDLILGLHSSFWPRYTDYQLTGLLAIPTGDKTYALTSGRVTFDVTNGFSRTFHRITPNIEVGIGDSSTLTNRLVTKNYTSLGPLAHFQTGIGLDLPRNASFEADAYEQLPIGDQKTYGPSRRGNTTVITGHNIPEDNGFVTSLDLPLDGHTTFSAYYSRSLRLHADTVAIGFTYVLRAAPPADLPDPNFDDLFR